MNWPHYTHSPPSINYLHGEFHKCGKTRKERQWQYLQKPQETSRLFSLDASFRPNHAWAIMQPP